MAKQTLATLHAPGATQAATNRRLHEASKRQALRTVLAAQKRVNAADVEARAARAELAKAVHAALDTGWGLRTLAAKMRPEVSKTLVQSLAREHTLGPPRAREDTPTRRRDDHDRDPAAQTPD